MSALPSLNDFGVEKAWPDMGEAEAGSVSSYPQSPPSSGHCSEAPTQLPSGVGVRVDMIFLGQHT